MPKVREAEGAPGSGCNLGLGVEFLGWKFAMPSGPKRYDDKQASTAWSGFGELAVTGVRSREVLKIAEGQK